MEQLFLIFALCFLIFPFPKCGCPGANRPRQLREGAPSRYATSYFQWNGGGHLALEADIILFGFPFPEFQFKIHPGR